MKALTRLCTLQGTNTPRAAGLKKFNEVSGVVRVMVLFAVVALQAFTSEGMPSQEALVSATNAAPREMKLFLLVGQSNMAGRGRVGAEAKKPIPRCFKLNQNCAWVEASTPIHFDRPAAGYGIANSFVRRYLAEHPNDTVGLIPCAVGGSPSPTWAPTNGTAAGGQNFLRALKRAQEAKKSGTIVGILWHQGESDIPMLKDPAWAEHYAAQLSEMVRVFRTELNCPDAPFLVGEIGTLPHNCTAMNPILKESAQRIPKAALVRAADLTGHLGDGIHFDAPSYEILGVRYYDAWERLSGAKLKERMAMDVASDVDYDLRDFVLTADVRYERAQVGPSSIRVCGTKPSNDGGVEFKLSGLKHRVRYWQRASIVKSGDLVQFFFDGNPVGESKVAGLNQGRIVFQTTPNAEGGKVLFRNMRFYETGK